MLTQQHNVLLLLLYVYMICVTKQHPQHLPARTMPSLFLSMSVFHSALCSLPRLAARWLVALDCHVCNALGGQPSRPRCTAILTSPSLAFARFNLLSVQWATTDKHEWFDKPTTVLQQGEHGYRQRPMLHGGHQLWRCRAVSTSHATLGRWQSMQPFLPSSHVAPHFPP